VKVNVSGGLQCQLSPSDHQEDHFTNTTESQEEVTVIHNHNEELDETAEKRVLSPNPLQKKMDKNTKSIFFKNSVKRKRQSERKSLKTVGEELLEAYTSNNNEGKRLDLDIAKFKFDVAKIKFENPEFVFDDPILNL
jgi:hypothetical protein